MSGSSPDGVVDKSRNFKIEAVAVLEFLNEKTGRRFEPVSANLNFIIARFKEGATRKACFQVIAKKFRDWSEKDGMLQYMRPATLFNKTKFWQYEGELLKQGGSNEKAMSTM